MLACRKKTNMETRVAADNSASASQNGSDSESSRDALHLPGPSKEEDVHILPEPDDGSSGQKPSTSVFHIDTARISKVPTSEQASELHQLGVSVFNQDEFEQGVLEQVDHAISVEEAKLARQRDEKELKTVVDDIRTCKLELKQLERVAASIRVPPTPSIGNKDLQRKLLSVRTQRENKGKQLKKLEAKHKSLVMRLKSNSDEVLDEEHVEQGEDGGNSSTSVYEQLLEGGGEDAPGPSKQSETEQERLIRLGEMTPFGTSLTLDESKSARKPIPKKPAVMTDFEKFLGQKDADVYKKHKLATKWKGTPKKKLKREESQESQETPQSSSSSGKTKMDVGETSGDAKTTEGRDKGAKGSTEKQKPPRKRMEFEPKYTKKTKDRWNSGMSYARRKRSMMRDLTENWDSDAEMEESWEDGDEEYYPGRDSEQEAEWDDAADTDYEHEPGRRYAKPKKRKLSEQIADGSIASQRDLDRELRVKAKRSRDSTRKVSDDSTQAHFYKRLKEQRKKELRVKQVKLEKRSSFGSSGENISDEDGSEEEDDVELDGGFKIPSKIWTKLYRYQKIGVKWLWELHRQQAGGIMGDEMGLGKTIQMIAFLAGLKNSRLKSKGFSYTGLGPVLIVCPATVLHQWVKEFHTWYPELRVAILHDSGSHSGKKETLVRDIARSHGILITSYSGVHLRQELLLHFSWHYVILDEGHKIRNPDAKVTLACKQFRTPHRLILTGSPMQNNLRELWSLIDFVFPGKLGTLPVFMQEFSVPITQGGYANASKVQVQTAYKCACILRDTISPYLLRRVKADVKQTLQLPPKNEQVLFCRLTEEQTNVYEDYLASKECNLILRGEYQVFAGLIKMRKICNHPDLVTGGPKIFTHENLTDDELSEEQRFGYYKRAGKMMVVEALLKIWKKQNHRVLLFSQSKQMLDIMEDFVQDRYTYMRMDGTTSIASRQPLITKFNSDPSIFVFLLTTRVGGLGVNLTGANRVIIYDPDWNPSTDMQARERTWRIGQMRHVTIYRLLTAGSIEEKIYHRQIFKQFLTNRVLKDPRQRRFFKSNDLFELFTLGSSDSNRTETSAIFAGTGSDVRPKSVKSKVKLEPPKKLGRTKDEKSKKRERRKESLDKKSGLTTQSSGTVKIKVEPKELDNVTSQDGLGGDGDDDGQGINETSVSCHSDRKSSHTDEQMPDSAITVKEEDAVQEQPVSSSTDTVDASRTSSSPWKPKSSSSLGHKHSSSSSGSRPSSSSSLLKARDKNLTPNQKKKRKKDAKLDGHRIPHLAKHKAYVPKVEGEEEAQKNANEDNYVLQKLFKKTDGIHSALQHDNIMQSASPDYLLVENEANRVAKEAANALRLSRRRCFSARAGIPTWTGASGGPGSVKPRFGQKSNSKLVDKTDKPTSMKPVAVAKKKKLTFGGKKAFSGDMSMASSTTDEATPNTEMPSSSSLLARMRARNHLINESDEDEDETRRVAPSGTEHDGLMTEIVSFVENGGTTPGQASTDELLKAFMSKVPTSNSAVFRSMLHQVCSFQRVENGAGVWKLKMEYL